jgi:hypothetical protein
VPFGASTAAIPFALDIDDGSGVPTRINVAGINGLTRLRQLVKRQRLGNTARFMPGIVSEVKSTRSQSNHRCGPDEGEIREFGANVLYGRLLGAGLLLTSPLGASSL